MFSIKSARGQSILSCVHVSTRMGTLQRPSPLAKLIEPALGICCSHSISIPAGARKPHSHLPWELLPRKIPSTASQWRRLSVFWYILDKHLLVIFIQKLEISGSLHIDSFLQLTQQQFVYQYWLLTLVDLRGCLWPRFRVGLRSLVGNPRVHAWHYQIVTQTDPQKNIYC